MGVDLQGLQSSLFFESPEAIYARVFRELKPRTAAPEMRVAAVAQHEFEQFYPQPGWVEHDPMEILTSQLSCAVEALGKVGARPRDVAAIGITNQRETVIVWERATGKPLYPAIV